MNHRCESEFVCGQRQTKGMVLIFLDKEKNRVAATARGGGGGRGIYYWYGIAVVNYF